MNDQLQELLTKVYSEGVAKATAEAERIISKAKADAENEIQKAKKEANEMVAKAEKQASELRTNTEADLKMAGNHTITALKQKITDLVLNATIDKASKQGFNDPEFVKTIILEALSSWTQGDASLTIAESLQAKLDEAFMASLKNSFEAKLNITFSPLLKHGFHISPIDGSYKLSFTDEDFATLFKNYLRPRTAKILFNS